MEMTLIWDNEAQDDVKQIYDYLKRKSGKAANELLNHLHQSAEPLRQFPNMGQIEPLLEDCTEGYRYLVVDKHYKLIYLVEPDAVHIITVWDCRQAPDRLRRFFH